MSVISNTKPALTVFGTEPEAIPKRRRFLRHKVARKAIAVTLHVVFCAVSVGVDAELGALNTAEAADTELDFAAVLDCTERGAVCFIICIVCRKTEVFERISEHRLQVRRPRLDTVQPRNFRRSAVASEAAYNNGAGIENAQAAVI